MRNDYMGCVQNCDWMDGRDVRRILVVKVLTSWMEWMNWGNEWIEGGMNGWLDGQY